MSTSAINERLESHTLHRIALQTSGRHFSYTALEVAALAEYSKRQSKHPVLRDEVITHYTFFRYVKCDGGV